MWMNQEPTNGDWLPNGDALEVLQGQVFLMIGYLKTFFGWFQDDSLWLPVYLDLMDFRFQNFDMRELSLFL